MTQYAYTSEAWKALVKKPEDRGKIFGELVKKMGGVWSRCIIAWANTMGWSFTRPPMRLPWR
jgi:hypothetical protein